MAANKIQTGRLMQQLTVRAKVIDATTIMVFAKLVSRVMVMAAMTQHRQHGRADDATAIN